MVSLMRQCPTSFKDLLQRFKALDFKRLFRKKFYEHSSDQWTNQKISQLLGTIPNLAVGGKNFRRAPSFLTLKLRLGAKFDHQRGLIYMVRRAQRGDFVKALIYCFELRCTEIGFVSVLGQPINVKTALLSLHKSKYRMHPCFPRLV